MGKCHVQLPKSILSSCQCDNWWVIFSVSISLLFNTVYTWKAWKILNQVLDVLGFRNLLCSKDVSIYWLKTDRIKEGLDNYVAIKLMSPYFKMGIIVTTDNFLWVLLLPRSSINTISLWHALFSIAEKWLQKNLDWIEKMNYTYHT